MQRRRDQDSREIVSVEISFGREALTGGVCNAKKTKTVIQFCVLIVALSIGSVSFLGSCHRDRIERGFDGFRVGNPNGFFWTFPI